MAEAKDNKQELTQTGKTADVAANDKTTGEVKPVIKWKGSYTNPMNSQRVLSVTETDGTTIVAPINWPGKQKAENIEALNWSMEEGAGGKAITRQTPGDFHAAVMPLFGQATVDGVPAGMINNDFFEKHEDKTYSYFMDQADSFLDRGTDAD